MSGSISRVLYPEYRDGDHYTGPAVAGRLCRKVSPSACNLPAGIFPGRETGCLVLQAAGFAMPLPLPTTRCALTAPFHPYLCCKQPSAVYFLWHCPAGYPGRSLAAAAPYPARTFLWMSFNPAAARPTQYNIIPQNQTFENLFTCLLLFLTLKT